MGGSTLAAVRKGVVRWGARVLNRGRKIAREVARAAFGLTWLVPEFDPEPTSTNAVLLLSKTA